MSNKSVRKTWGVTLEYDTEVYADTHEEAERLAKGLHGTRMGGESYVGGSWLIKEEITETTTISHSSNQTANEEAKA